MLGVKVGHTDFAVSYTVTVAVLSVADIGVPVLTVFQVVLNVVVIACQVIGNNIGDNLNAVLFSLGTKIGQILFCSHSTAADIESFRLVKPPPRTRSVGCLRR